MFKSIATGILLLTTGLYGSGGYFDVEANFDPLDIKNRSFIELNPNTHYSFSDKTWIVSPKLSFYLDGSIDVSCATGVRHTTDAGFIGHHVFWSLSQTSHGNFHQVGHSIDFLTPEWDYRINYYHPLTKNQTDDFFRYDTHKWIESEALWKGNHFNVGFGPKYNFFSRSMGFQTRCVVPFKLFNLGASIGYDHKLGLSGALSLSFNLYSTGHRSQLHGNIAHKSRVRYGKTLLPTYQKPQKPKHDEGKLDQPAPEDKASEPVDLEPVELPVQNIETPLEPVIPPVDNGSFWDIFRRSK